MYASLGLSNIFFDVVQGISFNSSLLTEKDWGVTDVVVGGCLGLSDDEMIEFSVRGEVKRGPAKPPPRTFGGRLGTVQDAD